MTTVFRPSPCTSDISCTSYINSHINSHHPSVTCTHTSSRAQDSLRKPATILLGAAALLISLVPAGTFKMTEAVPLAAIATGGAITCLAVDKHNNSEH
ncbi:MAG: hypothetical protein AB4050_11970 [Synechococcus sp.]